LRDADCLVLESNHDLDMLKVGPYPWVVKQRVLSRTGHLSNHAVSEFLAIRTALTHAHGFWCWRTFSNNNPDLRRSLGRSTEPASGGIRFWRTAYGRIPV